MIRRCPKCNSAKVVWSNVWVNDWEKKLVCHNCAAIFLIKEAVIQWNFKPKTSTKKNYRVKK